MFTTSHTANTLRLRQAQEVTEAKIRDAQHAFPEAPVRYLFSVLSRSI